jgi:WD40 repeat protein
MNSPDSEHPPRSPQQNAREITFSGEGNPFAQVSSAGNAAIDQSRHVTIYNYYYRQEASIVSVESVEPADDLPCPYQGLFHFGPEDAEFFFGREVFVSELIEAVQTRAFVPVLGASGSGKSSVVFAGLVPRLQQTGHWLFTHFRPGEDPFHGLALALVPLYAPNLDQTDQIAQARKLANYLRNQDFPLTDVIAQIQQNCPNQRVLLIADQFEELYTLCKDEPTRRQFLDCLLTCLPTTPSPHHPTTSPPLVLVATMRADFLGSALAYRPFADVLQAGDIKLGAMNREELTDVIEQPAARLGVTFEPGLVKRILDAVDQQPGNLPLLEFALTELWKRRHHQQLTHADYEAIGEVQGALARYADEQYARLSEAEKDQVRRIFIQLVRPGEGTEDTRRLATKAELGEDRWVLVKWLADTRLVVTSQDETKQETVEVVHEALIRNWGELRGWMESDREFRTWQERLRGAMQQWEATNRDDGALLRGAALEAAKEQIKARKGDLSPEEQEFIWASLELQQKQQRRRQQVMAGVVTIALVATGSAAWAWVQQQKALTGQVNAQFLADSLTMEAYLEVGLEEEAVTKAMLTGQALYVKAANHLEPGTRLRAISSIREVLYGVNERERLIGHSSFVNHVVFSPDGQTLASASEDGTVKLWTLEGEELHTLTGHNVAVSLRSFLPDIWNVVFSPDGQTLASASGDGTVKLWTLEGEELHTLTGHSDQVYHVVFSPDGQTLASASGDGTVKLWTLEGEELHTLTGHSSWVSQVVFSPDGQTLASASGDGTVKLWTLEGEELHTLTGHSSWVSQVVFSPDGQTLASASEDGTVKLWTLEGEELHTLTGHSAEVSHVVFSPDGQTLASASEDGTVKLWTLEGEELHTLTGHSSWVTQVVFSPDGQTLASASWDNTVKLWNFNLKDLTQKSCNWLETYLVKQSPELLMDLKLCQELDPSLRLRATPALVRNAEKLAREGKPKKAVALLRQAKTWDSSLEFNPRKRVKAVVAANELVSQAETLAEAGEVADATTKFAEAKNLDPSLDFDPQTRAQELAVESYLSKGKELVNSGKVDAALQAYRQAEAIGLEDGISAYDWRELCWVGSTYNQAEKVMFACDKAVALAPYDGEIIDSRGLARALTGDTQGAIADFKAFIESTSDEDAKAQRQGWVDALQKGDNPFTPEVLEELR